MEANLSRFARFIPLILVLSLAILIVATGLTRYLSFDALEQNRSLLKLWVNQNYLLVLMAMMALFTALTISAMPGVIIVTLAAGYLFGPWIGALTTAIAATTGAFALYYVGQSALGESLKRKLEGKAGIVRKVCDEIEQNTFWYMLSSRLVVTMPFHLVSLAAGMMSVRRRAYLAATFIGLLPAHFIYCWIGSGLNGVLTKNAHPQPELLMKQFMWPLLAVGFLSILLPAGIRLYKSRIAAR